jgi:hypothetical protein
MQRVLSFMNCRSDSAKRFAHWLKFAECKFLCLVFVLLPGNMTFKDDEGILLAITKEMHVF